MIAANETTEALLVTYGRSRDPRLRDLIIERHRPLVSSLAGRFVRPGVPFEDLVQMGWIALIGAVDRFDPSRGTRFVSYAAPCVVGEIKRYFRDRTWAIQVPRQLRQIASALSRTRDELTAKLQRSPTVPEMAEAFGVSEEMLLEAGELGSAYQPGNLEERRESNGAETSAASDRIGGPDPAMERITERAPLEAALTALDARKQRIIRLRFLQERTQRQVAEELGLSQMHISRLERRALRELRVAMARL